MAARNIQGTLINAYADHQRGKFSAAGTASGGNNKLGAHTSTGVFSFYEPTDITKGAVTAQTLMENTTAAFHAVYDSGVEVGQNPDFGTVSAETFKYNNSYYENVKKQADKPGVFGPNISVPDINNPQSQQALISDYADGESITSPTALRTNSTDDSNTDDFKSKGFGVDTLRNDPRRQTGISGPFNTNSRTIDNNIPQRATLGEYISSPDGTSGYLDHSEYNYEG